MRGPSSFIAAVRKNERRRVPRSPIGFWFIFVVTLSPGAGALGQIPGDNFWYSGATSGAWRIASNWGTGPSNFVVPGSTFGTTNTSTATFNNTSITTAIVPD